MIIYTILRGEIMATDYRKLCIELFGTDNVVELRRIAGKQKTGRKKSLAEKDIQRIIEMQQQGITTQEILSTMKLNINTEVPHRYFFFSFR